MTHWSSIFMDLWIQYEKGGCDSDLACASSCEGLKLICRAYHPTSICAHMTLSRSKRWAQFGIPISTSTWHIESLEKREFRRGMSCFSCMTRHVSPCNLMSPPFSLYLIFAIVERCTLNASNHSLPDLCNTTLMLIWLHSNYAWLFTLRLVKSLIV